MPGNDKLKAQLAKEIERAGDNIGAVMASLRKRMMAAQDADDDTAEAAAELLYLLASQVQFERQKIKLKAIVDSPEIKDLVAALKAANKLLKGEAKDLRALEKGIANGRKAIATTESIIKAISGRVV